ncbi:hypothetical protein KCP70_16685 [Salmonella enterica subsp. enterica]|nr:hypothetical protein KCP70_16685 [Salmonella enterica subsp. enterica]
MVQRLRLLSAQQTGSLKINAAAKPSPACRSPVSFYRRHDDNNHHHHPPVRQRHRRPL